MLAQIGLDMGDNFNIPILVSELAIGSIKSKIVRSEVP